MRSVHEVRVTSCRIDGVQHFRHRNPLEDVNFCYQYLVVSTRLKNTIPYKSNIADNGAEGACEDLEEQIFAYLAITTLGILVEPGIH